MHPANQGASVGASGEGNGVMITLMKKAVNWFLLLILDINTRYFGGNKQFLPTLENIENEDLKELANKLNGDSNKETLTNILEWQERNVLGWSDRMYMFSILYILLVLLVLFMVNPMVAQNMLPIHFFVLLSILFGALIGLILYFQNMKVDTVTFRYM